MALHGKHSQIILTSTPALSFTNLVLQDSGDHTTFFAASADAAKRYWDSTQTLTVQTSPDGTTWTNASPKSIRYLSGSVTFASAVSGGTPGARVSAGHYLPWSALAWVSEWAPDVSRDVKEDTRFTTSNTPTSVRTYVPGLLGGSFKITGFIVDPTTSNLALAQSESPLIASMVIDVATGARIECAGFLTKDSVKVNVDDLESEELDFQATGQIYFIPTN
jgi:hypothetical protein